MLPKFNTAETLARIPSILESMQRLIKAQTSDGKVPELGVYPKGSGIRCYDPKLCTNPNIPRNLRILYISYNLLANINDYLAKRESMVSSKAGFFAKGTSLLGGIGDFAGSRIADGTIESSNPINRITAYFELLGRSENYYIPEILGTDNLGAMSAVYSLFYKIITDISAAKEKLELPDEINGQIEFVSYICSVRRAECEFLSKLAAYQQIVEQAKFEDISEFNALKKKYEALAAIGNIDSNNIARGDHEQYLSEYTASQVKLYRTKEAELIVEFGKFIEVMSKEFDLTVVDTDFMALERESEGNITLTVAEIEEKLRRLTVIISEYNRVQDSYGKHIAGDTGRHPLGSTINAFITKGYDLDGDTYAKVRNLRLFENMRLANLPQEIERAKVLQKQLQERKAELIAQEQAVVDEIEKATKEPILIDMESKLSQLGVEIDRVSDIAGMKALESEFTAMNEYFIRIKQDIDKLIDPERPITAAHLKQKYEDNMARFERNEKARSEVEKKFAAKKELFQLAGDKEELLKKIDRTEAEIADLRKEIGSIDREIEKAQEQQKLKLAALETPLQELTPKLKENREQLALEGKILEEKEGRYGKSEHIRAQISYLEDVMALLNSSAGTIPFSKLKVEELENNLELERNNKWRKIFDEYANTGWFGAFLGWNQFVSSVDLKQDITKKLAELRVRQEELATAQNSFLKWQQQVVELETQQEKLQKELMELSESPALKDIEAQKREKGIKLTQLETSLGELQEIQKKQLAAEKQPMPQVLSTAPDNSPSAEPVVGSPPDIPSEPNEQNYSDFKTEPVAEKHNDQPENTKPRGGKRRALKAFLNRALHTLTAWISKIRALRNDVDDPTSSKGNSPFEPQVQSPVKPQEVVVSPVMPNPNPQSRSTVDDSKKPDGTEPPH